MGLKGQLPQVEQEEVNEISEDISEELKLLGMEDWLAAALQEDNEIFQTGSQVAASSRSNAISPRGQPEEEPGASEADSFAGELHEDLEPPSSARRQTHEAQEAEEAQEVRHISPESAQPEVAEMALDPPATPNLDHQPEEAAICAAPPESLQLFHISALDLGSDPGDDLPGDAGSSQKILSDKPQKRLPRRKRADIMLW